MRIAAAMERSSDNDGGAADKIVQISPSTRRAS
jgi:hypothetical protein